jgi:hypothetical protein
MEQAQVAADAILVALRSGDFAFAGYRAALRRATVGRELALDRWLAWLLYSGDDWRRWLSLVLYDERMVERYVARVCGLDGLVDHKGALLWSLAEHALKARGRMRALLEAEARRAAA